MLDLQSPQKTMQPVSIYLLRHGQSEGNAAGIIQGEREYGLTSLGQRQAQIAGDWMASMGIRPSVVYSSPQRRALETASIAAARMPGAPAPLAEEDLREMQAGELSGLTIEEAGRAYPDYVTRRLDERGCMARYGGESYEDLQARLTRVIARIAQHSEGDVLCVAHGGSLYHLLKLWCGWPAPRHFFARITNCCCIKVQHREVAGHRVGEMQWFVPVEMMQPGALARGLDSPDEG